ncbi:alpha/beta fold hydrolase [Sphingomonas sp. LaA6.9]|uniref:alpha/beta fold hydrolase n=1 Tax=Sphingomonas sp. LaA6.9 TaxID=2919914 RepID=UPI001F4F5387|nr:alpha/beta hydrolase [Sphingomonas sp. LaA6.9]MCJ8158997.1 alpha/beta hydrolase [Sphingomonas sp. LaA6.9]
MLPRNLLQRTIVLPDMDDKHDQRDEVQALRQTAWRSWTLGGSAIALAGAALFNRSRSKKAERDRPPIGDFVEVDGVRLHYLDRGSGPPLVLLHGNGATIEDYLLSGLIDEAAAHYRVIAFDRPGFGYSERPRSTIWSPSAQAELIFKALMQLDVERPIVLGHSWGTLAALAMALDHPEEIAALVLLAGYYFPTARPDAALLSPPAIPVIGDILRYTVSPLAGRVMAPTMFASMFSPDVVPANIGQWPLDMALRPSQIRAAAADTALMIPAASELSERYGELSLPIIIVGGVGDKIAHFSDQSAALHGTIASSELVTVAGAGHMVHYTAPERVMVAIDRARTLGSGGANTRAEDDLVHPPGSSAIL